MKRVPFVTLFSVVFALALTLAGCGGNSSTTPPLQTTGTSAAIGFGDAVNDNVAKFELTVTAITLTGVAPTANTGNLLAAPARLNLFTRPAPLSHSALARFLREPTAQ